MKTPDLDSMTVPELCEWGVTDLPPGEVLWFYPGTTQESREVFEYMKKNHPAIRFTMRDHVIKLEALKHRLNA